MERKERAVIVLHEIYGINQHIKSVCEHYLAAGYDVLCPNFGKSEEYFDYCREEEAYQYFVDYIGFSSVTCEVKRILLKAQRDYKQVFLIGFSVGATAAWICSSLGSLVDGVICYYGSRIRDYLNIIPKCPVLLICANEEKSYNVSDMTSALERREYVRIYVLNGKHGFCNPFCKEYNEQSAHIAQDLVDKFLDNTH